MRILIIFLLSAVVLLSSESIEIKKGWQLIGLSSSIKVQNIFDTQDIEIVWAYDAASQNWSGYSSDTIIDEKIRLNYDSLENLKAYQAVWVLSKKDFTLEYEVQDSVLLAENNIIFLEKGWNLVSIAQSIVLSEHFFDDLLVWRYDSDRDWGTNNDSLNFPSIETIKQSEGLWIKSDVVREIDISNQASVLHSFSSREKMLAYIRKMLEIQSSYYGYDAPIAFTEDGALDAQTSTSENAESSKNATTTNLQELGVDEGDILKHDGTYIFNVDNVNQKVVVSSFENLAQQKYLPITTLSYSAKRILSLYVQSSRLIVISVNQYYDAYPTDIAVDTSVTTNTSLPYPQDKQNVTLDVYDIGDINAIERIATHTIDGSYNDSRLIDGSLYLISQFYPQNYDVDSKIEDEDLVPHISSNAKESVDLLNPNSFYAPNKLNQSANITTISRFSITDGTYKLSSSFLGNTHTNYASTDSLYLVSDEYPLYYDYRHYKEQQMIYKFALDANISYRAKGLVEGRTLSQFSMSEKDDYLRVATTSGWSWWDGGNTINSVYTLKESEAKLSLEGKLTGLGHEGETIRSVRFVGDRAFVVTFRQTDPLYTLDMSNPQKPSVVGELSIPGFSTYLHPIDENRLLSIGRNADTQGRQLELQFQLFDISDFANPSLVDKIQIGDANSYSEAEYNHKAFAYRASDTMFGVQYYSYMKDYSRSEYFDIYQVKDLSIVPIVTIESAKSEWGDSGRGLIFDLNSTSYGALLKGENMICEEIKEDK